MSTALTTPPPGPRADLAPTALSRLWRRELPHYPTGGRRVQYLAITVAATVVLYYMAYVQGAVGTSLIAKYDMSFNYFVWIAVIANGVGALASAAAGLADRWGRANLVVGGLLLAAGLVLAQPHAPTKTTYLLLATALGLVEGVVLVATPALIRDFSPQVGRGQAMGFWTLGPVLGSLTVTIVTSNTLDAHPGLTWQYTVAGVAGLAVFVLALLGLRELSPQLRDQLMVSERDRVLVEARAAGIDPEQALQGHWRQVLRSDVVGPAFAISVFLLLYYALVGFLVVYFATVYGWSASRANALGNWYWGSNAVALVVAGALTDRLRVRKPFMLVGAGIGLVATVLFARTATQPDTGYYYLAFCFALSAIGGGMAYVAWMAAFTETVERHNPAATATGLAVWGLTLRTVVSVSLVALTFIVPATNTLVDHGPRVQEIAARYPDQVAVLSTVDAGTLAALQADPADQAAQARALSALTGITRPQVELILTYATKYTEQIATAQAVDPAVLAQLKASPTDSAAIATAVQQIATRLGVTPAQAGDRLVQLATSSSAVLEALASEGPAVQAAAARLQSVGTVPAEDLAYLSAHGADVAKAQEDNPGQWQTWWWVCVLGQLAFLPFVFVLSGRWSPRKAREDALEHERLVEAELAALAQERAAGAVAVPSARSASDEAARTGA